MNQIILASHGMMSAGVKDTAELILGELPYVYAVATTRDETETIDVAARRLLEMFDENDKVYVLTDVLGGSVNNNMISLQKDYPDMTIICGMNLCLVLNLASTDEEISENELEEYMEQARAQLMNCSAALKHVENSEEEDDL